jgi:hypothetical protein
MSINKPFYRSCRAYTDGSYSEGGRWQYITHPKYAKAPEQYIRAFLLLQKDLKLLFDYIEPSDTNLPCYSYRTHELLMRTCIEIEANFKAILNENGYEKRDRWGNDIRNIADFKKVETTHRLSSYQVKIPTWHGGKSVRIPFASWDNSPKWYKAYNMTKHNRHDEFHNANFENLLDSICGLLILLSSQFYTEDFSPGNSYLVLESGKGDDFESAIGGYFRIKFPDNWPLDQRYDFSREDWERLSQEENPFQQIDYHAINLDSSSS